MDGLDGWGNWFSFSHVGNRVPRAGGVARGGQGKAFSKTDPVGRKGGGNSFFSDG